MGGGNAGGCFWFTFSDCTAPAITRHIAEHRFRRPARAFARRVSARAMVPRSGLAKRPEKTGRSTASHSQRATVAHVSIDASISSRLELVLFSPGSRLESGGAQESLDFHRSGHCGPGRRSHRGQFFTATNSLLAAHAAVGFLS